ncbi:MAG: response regulator transcription factor [Vampirovibrionales bacterium]|nr:response regulator transcription factor [Vampirovibrionales bacterium]
MSRRVLLVDDEQDIVRLVRYNLEHAGYHVFCAFDGKTAIEAYRQHAPELIILDLMLPDKPGKVICEEIRTHEKTLKQPTRVPIMMLTARASEHDRVSGFEAGADDYITKPFSPRELVLRVKAMFERIGIQQKPAVFETGPLRLDTLQVQAWIANEPVALTPIEFRILATLAQYAGVVRTREQLLNDVWPDTADEILDRTVDAHVKRLRAKLGKARDMLETIRGVGYRLKPQANTL